MAGYIGAKQGVTQVDGYNRSEADAEFVQVTGDTMTGNLTVTGKVTANQLEIANSNANNELTFSGAEYTNIYSETTSGFDIGTNSTGGSSYLRLITENTERVRVDSAGRVTMPYQPMASVSFVNVGTTASGSYELVYTSVLVNVGSHYNASNGRFTCPATGVYRVSAFGMGTLIAGNHNFFVAVIKNGSQQGATAYNYGTPEDYKHASGNWLVSCVVGDYLSIFVGGTGGYYGYGYQGATFELIG